MKKNVFLPLNLFLICFCINTSSAQTAAEEPKIIEQKNEDIILRLDALKNQLEPKMAALCKNVETLANDLHTKAKSLPNAEQTEKLQRLEQEVNRVGRQIEAEAKLLNQNLVEPQMKKIDHYLDSLKTKKNVKKIIIIDSDNTKDTISFDIPKKFSYSMQDDTDTETNTDEQNTLKNKKQGKRVEDYLFIDFGTNVLMQNNTFDLTGDALILEQQPNFLKSLGWGFTKLWSHRLGSPYVRIASGFGFNFDKYALLTTRQPFANGDTLRFSPINNNISVDKNKIATNFVHVPLMLHFKTNPRSKKGLNIAAGVEAAYCLWSKSRYEYTQNGNEVENHTRNNLNINPFRLSAVARVGIARVDFFAKYALTPLFEASFNPNVTALTVGLSLGGF